MASNKPFVVDEEDLQKKLNENVLRLNDRLQALRRRYYTEKDSTELNSGDILDDYETDVRSEISKALKRASETQNAFRELMNRSTSKTAQILVSHVEDSSDLDELEMLLLSNVLPSVIEETKVYGEYNQRLSALKASLRRINKALDAELRARFKVARENAWSDKTTHRRKTDILDHINGACAATTASYKADPAAFLSTTADVEFHEISSVASSVTEAGQHYMIAEGVKRVFESVSYGSVERERSYSTISLSSAGIELKESTEKRDDVVYISFRGSTTLPEWLACFPSPGSLKGISYRDVGTFHGRFFELAKSFPLSFIKSCLEDGKIVVITGHSLGAAVAATVTTLFLKRYSTLPAEQLQNLFCITFCLPPFADTFAMRFIETSLFGMPNAPRIPGNSFFLAIIDQQDFVARLLTLLLPAAMQLSTVIESKQPPLKGLQPAVTTNLSAASTEQTFPEPSALSESIGSQTPRMSETTFQTQTLLTFYHSVIRAIGSALFENTAATIQTLSEFIGKLSVDAHATDHALRKSFSESLLKSSSVYILLFGADCTKLTAETFQKAVYADSLFSATTLDGISAFHGMGLISAACTQSKIIMKSSQAYKLTQIKTMSSNVINIPYAKYHPSEMDHIEGLVYQESDYDFSFKIKGKKMWFFSHVTVLKNDGLVQAPVTQSTKELCEGRFSLAEGESLLVDQTQKIAGTLQHSSGHDTQVQLSFIPVSQKRLALNTASVPNLLHMAFLMTVFDRSSQSSPILEVLNELSRATGLANDKSLLEILKVCRSRLVEFDNRSAAFQGGVEKKKHQEESIDVYDKALKLFKAGVDKINNDVCTKPFVIIEKSSLGGVVKNTMVGTGVTGSFAAGAAVGGVLFGLAFWPVTLAAVVITVAVGIGAGAITYSRRPRLHIADDTGYKKKLVAIIDVLEIPRTKLPDASDSMLSLAADAQEDTGILESLLERYFYAHSRSESFNWQSSRENIDKYVSNLAAFSPITDESRLGFSTFIKVALCLDMLREQMSKIRLVALAGTIRTGKSTIMKEVFHLSRGGGGGITDRSVFPTINHFYKSEDNPIPEDYLFSVIDLPGCDDMDVRVKEFTLALRNSYAGVIVLTPSTREVIASSGEGLCKLLQDLLEGTRRPPIIVCATKCDLVLAERMGANSPMIAQEILGTIATDPNRWAQQLENAQREFEMIGDALRGVVMQTYKNGEPKQKQQYEPILREIKIKLTYVNLHGNVLNVEGRTLSALLSSVPAMVKMSAALMDLVSVIPDLSQDLKESIDSIIRETQ